MVSDTVAAALVGVFGALGGSLLTGGLYWLTSRQKLDAENRQILAEYYLEARGVALIDVYESLQETRRILGDYGQNPPETQQEYEEVVSAQNAYWRAFKNAKIYLRDSRRESILRETWVQFCTIKSQIEVAAQSDGKEAPNVRWDDFRESIEEAEAMLEEVINEPIKNFEK